MNEKIALVTGAASGIGLATAKRLVAAGYRVTLVDRDEASLALAASAFPDGAVLTLPLDVGLPDAPALAEEAIGRRWEGKVGILVNNAAISPKHDGRSAGLAETTDVEWNEVMQINLFAAFNLCRRFAPAMKADGWGRIVNVSSLAGRTRSAVASPAYMASKAGLLGLTRSIASEYAAHGITANAVAPGRIDTPMASGSSTAVNANYLPNIPVQRFGRPDEVAATIAHLASDDAAYITGAVVDVNGGIFMS